jgi:hypothetical protein
MKSIKLWKKCFVIFISLLYIINTQAQSIQHSPVPPPDFEVSASLYPWDVHDEGIELMLDNLISMSGVNSVYLLAVMHQEHRPFFGPKEFGPWLYPHNPARQEWWAEDSRAYFHPQMNLYKNIKPILSSFPWLRDTDWLKVVVDAARKRGLKVGAEVSHTYIPRDILVNHPEYQQQYLSEPEYQQNNHPYTGAQMIPCINNPEVREYLKALYFDLAKNYDIDYVQTCMYTSMGDDVRNGTCFCENCQKEAKTLGFDLKAAIPILKDNPNAQPQLNQWLDFRIASTTKIYKMIIDAMREGNPKIDFRINDLNNRSTGLHLEDLEGYITSIHMSTHTEQYGYEKSDRESRIQTMQYFLPEVPILPGIPVRILATPEIVKSSIKKSVDNGVEGIALKHYDGASYSLLRAVRDGLSEAGVQGFNPIIGMEVEDMELSGYLPDTFLIEKGVMSENTGTATSIFTNPSGNYDVVISYADEKDGQGTISLFVADKQRATFKLNEDVGVWRRKTFNNIKINNGDEIKIVGVANGSEAARVDYIEFIKK